MAGPWQRFWKSVDWGSRIQFLWMVATWIFTHTIQAGLGAVVIAVVWAYLTNIPAVFVFIFGLLAFGCILWISNGLASWLERRKRLLPPSKRLDTNVDIFDIAQVPSQQGTKIVACFKGIYIKAMNQLSSGYVNPSLFCDITLFHWCGLKDQNFPYIVVQVEVGSQFPFNLKFIKPTAIECDLLLNKVVISKQAELIWNQIQWVEPEKPTYATEPINIPALGKPDLLFRFQIDKSIRDDIVLSANTKTKSEWNMNTDWKLHCAEADKAAAYNVKLRPKEFVADLTK